MEKIKKIFKIGLLLVVPIFFISIGMYMNLEKSNIKNNDGEWFALSTTVQNTCTCERSLGGVFGTKWDCSSCNNAQSTLQNKCSGGEIRDLTYSCSYNYYNTVYGPATSKDNAETACKRMADEKA